MHNFGGPSPTHPTSLWRLRDECSERGTDFRSTDASCTIDRPRASDSWYEYSQSNRLLIDSPPTRFLRGAGTPCHTLLPLKEPSHPKKNDFITFSFCGVMNKSHWRVSNTIYILRIYIFLLWFIAPENENWVIKSF